MVRILRASNAHRAKEGLRRSEDEVTFNIELTRAVPTGHARINGRNAPARHDKIEQTFHRAFRYSDNLDLALSINLMAGSIRTCFFQGAIDV
jgi:hypothetical protein